MQAKLAASKPKGYKLQGQNCRINSSKTEALGGGGNQAENISNESNIICVVRNIVMLLSNETTFKRWA